METKTNTENEKIEITFTAAEFLKAVGLSEKKGKLISVNAYKRPYDEEVILNAEIQLRDKLKEIDYTKTLE